MADHTKNRDISEGNSLNEVPLITVITVVLNGMQTIEKTILSVINQSYDKIEYIIIDGGSTDGTVDIIRKYAHSISYWESGPDGGIYDAWNKGIEAASGSWICFLGSDDFFWETVSLSRMVPFMIKANPDTRLLYGSVAIVTRQNNLIRIIGKMEGNARTNHIGIRPGMMIHRSWFKAYGCFDISYRITSDHEMLLRASPKERFDFIPGLIVSGMMQGGISSNPNNSIKILYELRRALKSHGMPFPEWLLYAFFRFYIRRALKIVLGKRLAYILLDFVRKILGKDRYWTNII